jgi:hypothetical protein
VTAPRSSASAMVRALSGAAFSVVMGQDFRLGRRARRPASPAGISLRE